MVFLSGKAGFPEITDHGDQSAWSINSGSSPAEERVLDPAPVQHWGLNE
jgi:hypothetical protein